ncbi:MAG: glucose-1-phosphate adenylyltransferase [Desulfuromusa sp.]|nr:glucose-1-phosphate adenylyltransferase [Desulfuromusa sp.]
MIDETLTIILAGGHGSRLYPLTKERAKPAVPFGGKYRVIDFTLANCLHSGLRRVLVLTQYKSLSLQKHLRDGWSIFNPELGEYITSVPPQMRSGERWYGGTADAVFQNLYLLERSGAKWVLILAGDHIYRMDYAAMLKSHQDNDAVMTVACMDVGMDKASEYGVMSVDADYKITQFEEKPTDPMTIPEDPQVALASMGIYVFSIDRLIEALEKDAGEETSSHDFGKDIIPQLINTEKVYAHRFGSAEGRVTPDKYWRDVGTLDSYYEANMDLLKPVPPIDLYQPDWPIRTYQMQYPPARTVPGREGSEGISINSITSSGVVISGGSVQQSILSSNVFVDDEASVYESLLFEGVRVGRGAQLQRCIVDKDVVIPDGETIGFDAQKDAERFTISESGVVVVPKGYCFT